ncbi:MAG: 2-hydroxyacyl-CoA dehydratase [Candidatus Helarchaeota archaeon]
MTRTIIPYEIIYEAADVQDDLIARVLPEHEQQVLKSFLKNLKSALSDILEAAREGKPILGYHFAFPAEIFYCFDLAPVCFELLPYMYSAFFRDGAEYFYERINAWGHPYHSCTSQKGMMAMIQEGLIDLDVICTPTGPCDNTVASYQFFSNYKKKKTPLIVADLPVYQNDRAKEYYAEELKSLLEQVGKIIGQEPDYGRLKTAVKNNREAHEYLIEINQLKRTIPCPLESLSNSIITSATVFLPGRPEKVQFLKEVYEVTKKRVQNNESRPGFEKHRSVWPYLSLFFDLSFYEWMDREIGMTQVIDPFNIYFYEPIYSNDVDEILTQIAVQSQNYPMVRQGSTFIETLIDDSLWAAREFKADCAIFTAHYACKQIVSAIQILKEAFRDELGIPMLTIELDCGDKRFTSIQSIKEQVSEFARTLL